MDILERSLKLFPLSEKYRKNLGIQRVWYYPWFPVTNGVLGHMPADEGVCSIVDLTLFGCAVGCSMGKAQLTTEL